MNLVANGKFNHDLFGDLSVYQDDNNNCWFVAREVATALGYKNISKAISDNCKGGNPQLYPLLTAGGIQDVRVINEPDLYRLIFSSKLESAVKFQDWVFEEVLTSIRKTGMYATQDIIERMIDDKIWATGLLFEVKKHLDHIPKQIQKQAIRNSKRDFAGIGELMGSK